MTNQQGAPEALEDHQVRKLAAIGAVRTSSGLVERRPIEYRRELENQFVRGFRAAEKRLAALVEAQQPAPSAAAAVGQEPNFKLLRKALADRRFRGETDLQDLVNMAANIIAEDGAILRARQTIIEQLKTAAKPSPTPQADSAAPSAAAAGNVLPEFEELDDDLIDLACSTGALYRVDFKRAWEVMREGLRTPQPSPTPQADSAPAEAVQRIVHLRADRERRVYVAGPMTGLPEYNFPLFNATAARLRSEGWHVENPAEHGHVDGAGWSDYLRWDISRIATCGAIYLLPGWSKSKGAMLEVHIAGVLGLQVLLADGAEAPHADSQPAPVRDYPPLPRGWPARFRCDSCDGNGEVGEPISMGHFQPPERERCPDCDGRGWCSEEDAFSADHMRAYVDADRAARAQAADSVLEDAALSQAARDVLAERQRQISAEGWTPEHDDEQHLPGELALAAASYVCADENDAPPAIWPWALNWWKPRDRRRNLTKAGALILAELERIDRAARKQGGA